MKSKLIMSGLAALGVMVGTSSAYADAARDAMAQRLAPAGQLCLQGQDCGTAAAPAAASNGGDSIDGAGIYDRVCMACHETGAAGAPVRGDEAAWSERIEQGFATLLEHSINGIGAMPARGGNPNLSDEEMEASTAYLLEPVMDVPELGGGDAADDAVAEESTAEETTADEGASEDVAAAEEAADETAAASEEEVASAGNGFDGEALYGTAGCAACHNNGVAGAPVLGDADAWAERLDKGIDTLYANSIGGIGAMPPKGGNMRLEDEEVMAIVDYMVAEVE